MVGLIINIVGLLFFEEHSGHSHGGEQCHGHGHLNAKKDKHYEPI